MVTQARIRSREQILADLVRSISINTDITSFDPGSDIGTLLEAVSEAINQTEVSTLKILESTNIDSLVGQDLDKKAQSSRIPNGQGGFGRKPATQASGPIIIGSAFQKLSTRLYAGKPAPFAGSKTLNVEDAAQIPSSGASVYIGRGTVDRFEGPIAVSNVVNNGSFWTITLDESLTKDHLQSDVVTLAQGGDRTVSAGTVVQIPSNSESPAVNFVTTRDLLIPDGESEGTVNVLCQTFGTAGNALAGAITAFASPPFAGATVRNSTTFRNGQSTESDEDLRQRIKNFPATLSRGTAQAIRSAISGATDPESGRTIQNATVLAPVEPGDEATVIIDDGSGLEPTFDNQSFELLLKQASGKETRFRTAQFPITPSLLEGVERGPFTLQVGDTLTAQVGDIIETYSVSPDNYNSLNSASAFEVVRDLNAQSNILGFRTVDDGTRIVATDLSGEAERVSVKPSNWQQVIGFPTAEIRPIFLYKNSELLSFLGKTATLETRPRNLWNITESDLQNLRVRVDNVIQEFSIEDGDFAEFDSNVSNATVSQYATVLSRKVAGVRFTTSGQVLVWSTFNAFSPEGQLEILTERADGTPAQWIGDDKIWLSPSSGGQLADQGAAKDFNFNRFTGEINLLKSLDKGDSLELATRDTRAFIRSAETDTGLFNLAPIPTTIGNSKLIVGFDGSFALRQVSISTDAQITPTEPDSINAANVVRVSANTTGLFGASQVGDYFYIIRSEDVTGNKLPSALENIYRIISKGFHTTETDLNFGGVVASTETFNGITANVFQDSTRVRILKTDHGLKTGDLITVQTTAAIGGISAADLSVSDAQVTKISDGIFEFDASAPATSNSSGVIDLYGTNRILVSQNNHTLSTGALIVTSVSTGFGGLTGADLSVTKTVDVADKNSYYYRANKAVLSADNGTITTLTKKADTWVEFEVSQSQFSDWSPVLNNNIDVGQNSLYVFQCDKATPQLIDFGGSVGTLPVDDVIQLINSQVASGEAVKVSPRQIDIRSTDFSEKGTVAVLAAVGNAVNLMTEFVSSAIQSHIAAQSSQNTQIGAPVVSDVVLPTDSSQGYSSRTYLSVDRNITNVTTNDANPVIQTPGIYHSEYPTGFQQLWMTGKQQGFSARVYNNQTTAPYTGILTGSSSEVIQPLDTFDAQQTDPESLDRYSNFGLRVQDLPLNENDALVVEMNQDPVESTVNVPMTKIAKIQDIDAITGAGQGQVISFRLLDPEDSDRPFFDPTSVYKDFDFTDFKILTKSVLVYKQDGSSDRALIVRSRDFGGTHQIRFSIQYAGEPNLEDIRIAHTSDFFESKTRTHVVATLPSSPVIVGSTLGSGQYKITPTLNGTLYDWRISAPQLNSSNLYQAGNLLNISGSSKVIGTYKIKNALSANYSGLSATIQFGTNEVFVTKSSHGFQTGDLANITVSSTIAGLTPSELSVNNATVNVVNSNTFKYTASNSAPSTFNGTLNSVEVETPVTITGVSAETADGTATITVTSASHGLVTGDLVDVTTSTDIGGLTASQLSVSGKPVTVVNANVFQYDANPNVQLNSVDAIVILGSKNVIVENVVHGLVTGDLVDVTTSNNIGGLTSSQLSVSGKPVTVTDADTFSYEADTDVKFFNVSATTTNGSLTIAVNVPGHGLKTSDSIDVSTTTGFGGLSAAQLSVTNASVTVIDANNIEYTADAAATSSDSGTLDELTAKQTADSSVLGTVDTVDATTFAESNATGSLDQIDYTKNNTITGAFAEVTSSSSTVTISSAGHGVASGDLISVNTSNAIGGISAANLSVAGKPITVIDANTFTYAADAVSPATGSGTINTVVGGAVTVISPGDAGISTFELFGAAVSPIKTFEIVEKTFEDIATKINEYFPANPVATAEAIGTDLAINPVTTATYELYPNSVVYPGEDISGAFGWHAFKGKYSGFAGIFSYDSSNPTLNNIKATVQSQDAIFPLASEVAGTDYQPVGEEVQIVPTNTKTLEKWLNFSAVSSLRLLTEVKRHNNDSQVQLASFENGADGAVRVTGVSANRLQSSVIGNASSAPESTIRLKALSANVEAMVPGQFVELKNILPAEISRTYRDEPKTPAQTTIANISNVNDYFRAENSIKYVRVNKNTGRLIFLRNGQAPSQDEPLAIDNTITLTDLGNGLVQVTSAQGTNPDSSTGRLSARNGDMMYVKPTGTPFPLDVRCKGLGNTGRTVATEPEYLGYPVVHVIDDENIIVIAPNITSFGTTVLTSATDLVFIPAIYNEKNIQTNHAAGAKFDRLVNDGKAYYLLKTLGNGLVSVFLQNSPNESTDDMLLNTMSVSTDDYVIFGDGFDPANKGTYRLVAHNGRNHIVIYNPNGGNDQIIDENATSNGGQGQRDWKVGPLDDGLNRQIRIVAGDSVRIGDKLRISSPAIDSQWFNDVFFGSWEIVGLGYQGLDYSGFSLPHNTGDGSVDEGFFAPYVDFSMPDAPESIKDGSGNAVDSFLIAGNKTAIGFVEGQPFTGYRTVAGHSVSSQNSKNRELFLRPQLATSKISATFNTQITALNKLGFDESAVLGIDAYKLFSGLVQQAHRIIDGLPSNTISFPGVKAAGTQIAVNTPLIRSIQLELQVRPTDGVSLNSISELIKSAVAGYINELPVGQPVVISQIQRVVQSLPGVFSVQVLNTLPAADDDRIVVSDIEQAFVLDVSNDISVG